MSAAWADSDYEAVIGLECHVQLATRSKIFTAAAATFGGEPNSHLDPHSLGLPGSLPVLNRQVVELALRLGLACGCQIARRSEFSRKHYFYPDLPKGYQISQYDAPICVGGAVEFIGPSGERQRVRLIRIHLEEDAGKSIHLEAAALHSGSLIDYNRAGVALLEVVSEPELRSPGEAADYLRAIRQLCRYLQISDGNMEEGSLRCDANVSVRRRGTSALGQRTEIKNLNSFKFVEQAIEYELGRQVALVRGGGRVVGETRGWDSERGITRSQRSKEEVHDYRYFPDPDLPPLYLSQAEIDRVAAALPLLPLHRRDRYLAHLGLSPEGASQLSSERELADFFDALLVAAGLPEADLAGSLSDSERGLAKSAANWLLSELLGRLHRDGKSLAESLVKPQQLAELLQLLADDTISGKQAKELFARMYQSGDSAAALVDSLGLRQLRDPTAIAAVCQQILAEPAHQKQVAGYAKNPKLLGFFVGKVLAATAGRANPELVSATLVRLLSEKS